jgi:hypothetical protein
VILSASYFGTTVKLLGKAGNYYVSGHSNNVSMHAAFSMFLSPTSIPEKGNVNNNTIVIYNAESAQIRINSSTAIQKVELYSSLGETNTAVAGDGTVMQVSATHLNNGIVFVRVYLTDGSMFLKKVIFF